MVIKSWWAWTIYTCFTRIFSLCKFVLVHIKTTTVLHSISKNCQSAVVWRVFATSAQHRSLLYFLIISKVDIYGQQALLLFNEKIEK